MASRLLYNHLRFYLYVRVARRTVYLFNDVSRSELNLALRKGWSETSALNIVFSLALSYYYLQRMIYLVCHDSFEILPITVYQPT